MPASVFQERFRCPSTFDVFDSHWDHLIQNFRLERYAQQKSNFRSKLLRTAYYALRPLMPFSFRRQLQRVRLRDWKDIPFPRWPVDITVEQMFELMVTLSLKANGVEEMPFVWFWPSGYSGCIIMTHDVETAAGRDFCLKLREMDAAFGMKSSFQIVPEDSYEVPRSFLDELRASGCEVNLHGLNHSGYLFTNRTTFLREVAGINRYAKEYGARGFRAPVMYRNLDWYGDFDISYDMSVPNTAHLDPQRGGCCTVMPYFIGRVVELPLTTLQDYTLFHILGERRIDTWKRQVERILDKHGLVSFNVHPDYVKQEPFTGLYKQLLEYLAHICAERKVWIAAPGEVDSWWRQRSVTQPAGSALTALARTDGKHVDYQRRTFRIGVNA